MTLEEKISLLKRVPLFQGLSEAEAEVVAKSTTEKNYPSGEIIIEQDDVSGGAFLIYSGSVKVYRFTEEGQEVNLAILGPGEVIGEMSLLDNEPRSANVEAIQETEVLELTKADFSRILQTYPDTAINLLATLSHRVRLTNQHVEDVLVHNLTDRTWKTLQALVHYFPNQEISLSQEELSAIIGATRSRVTEILNELESEGKIRLSHRKIHLN